MECESSGERGTTRTFLRQFFGESYATEGGGQHRAKRVFLGLGNSCTSEFQRGGNYERGREREERREGKRDGRDWSCGRNAARGRDQSENLRDTPGEVSKRRAAIPPRPDPTRPDPTGETGACKQLPRKWCAQPDEKHIPLPVICVPSSVTALLLELTLVYLRTSNFRESPLKFPDARQLCELSALPSRACCEDCVHTSLNSSRTMN